MTMTETCINENEQSIRKQWLISSIILFFGSPLCLLGLFSLFSLFPGIDLLGALMVGTLQLALIYRCAYKKPGTRLLTVWMILSPMRFVGDASRYFQLNDFNSVAFSFFLLAFVLLAWWISLSLKLRKINHRLKLAK